MINLKPCILQMSLSCPPFCFLQSSKLQLVKPRYNQMLFWCACTARRISTNHAHLICCGTVSVTGQIGGCKSGQIATMWLKTFMPRLVVCSRNLHWFWINWSLLCDTVEVSMLRLVWLPIAQHVYQPALTGRLELISWKFVSCEWEQRLSRWSDFAKNCLLRIGCKELARFREKYRALGRHVCKIR